MQLVSRFPTYVITNHQRHRRTDGQTDDPKTAHMHLSALRGKNYRRYCRTALLFYVILEIGNKMLLEKADKFCYCGDKLDADRGCDSAVMEAVGSAWKKFFDHAYITWESDFVHTGTES